MARKRSYYEAKAAQVKCIVIYYLDDDDDDEDFLYSKDD